MTGNIPGPVAPAGWYADPEMADTRRYWDGQRWSDHVAPYDITAAQPSSMQAATLSSRPTTKEEVWADEAHRRNREAQLDKYRTYGWLWFLIFLPLSIYYGIRLRAGGRTRQGVTLIAAATAWWVAVVVVIGLVSAARATPSDRIDYVTLEPRIQQWGVALGATVQSVNCPDHVDINVGQTFNCRLVVGNGAVNTIEVTLASSDGDVTWTVAGQ